MTLPLLDIPDDPQAWPEWLEGQLVGPELGDLVEALTTVLEAPANSPALEELCGPQLATVLTRGLSALEPEQIRRLLKHPQRLLDLQERILCEGGPYWMTKIETPAASETTRRQWEQLVPQLRAAPLPTVPSPSWRRRAMLVGTLAAGLLVAVWWSQSGGEWGWNRPGVLTAQLDADPFLHQLADRAEEFLQRPRGNAADLERQIAAFRRSCDALLAAPLTQLEADDRTWLKDRCRVWAGKFDRQLSALREGTRPWQDVRDEADATVRTLATALRDRRVS